MFLESGLLRCPYATRRAYSFTDQQYPKNSADAGEGIALQRA
jgi:hypothetical protein